MSTDPAEGRLIVLRHPDLRRYLTARFIASIATQVQTVAVGWQVFRVTGDPFDLGLVALSQFLPFILLILPAGHVADRYDRRRIQLVTYVLLIGLFAFVIFLIFPPLVREAVQFVDDIPRIAEDLRNAVISLINSITGQPGSGEELIDSLTAGAQGAAPEIGSLLTVPLTLVGILTNSLVVIFLSALMLIERDRVRAWALEFVDERDRETLLGVTRNALLRLGAYVRGQLLVMAIIGIGSTAGMLVLGVPFAVPLGALSFITAAIPLAGAFIAGAPIVLVALTVSPGTALLMALWLVVLQQLEGSVITPYIQGRVVNLSAIAVLLGVIAGTSIAGIVGGIIAIPLVAVADVVLRDIVFPLRRHAEARRPSSGTSDVPAL